jgi:hypothetical protein
MEHPVRTANRRLKANKGSTRVLPFLFKFPGYQSTFLAELLLLHKRKQAKSD